MSPRHLSRIEDLVLRKVFDIATWMLGTFGVLVGILIIGGGPERWEGEAFKIALKLPYAPDTWGWLIFFFGAMVLFGMTIEMIGDRLEREHEQHIVEEISRHTVGIGCSLSGLWCFSIGTTFLCQLISDGRQVSNIVFAVWFFVGLWYLLRAAVNLKFLQ